MLVANVNGKIKTRIVSRISIAVLLAMILAMCAGLAQTAQQDQKTQKPQKLKPAQLSKGYQEWLTRDVVYIITKEEKDTFLRLSSDEARDKFIQRFWEIRNPTPGSPTNSYKDEIYQRIAFANSRFSVGSGEEGWRTPRGQTYITMGAPQQKQVYRNSANMYPLEIWFYSNLNPDLPPFFYVMFYQREGTGEYYFYSPYLDGPSKLVTGTESIDDNARALKMIQDSVGPEVARVSQTLLPDEPLPGNGNVSLESDLMLSALKNLPNMPFTKAALEQRRNMLESVTSRFVVEGKNLDIVTLPVRDSHGLTRLDYAVRMRSASDLSLTEGSDGRYTYSIEVRVRVFAADNKLIFTQQQAVSDNLDKQRLNQIKERPFGYEGTLPLPPGKYRLDFLLTDWAKKTGFHTEREVIIPTVDANGLVVPGVLPFAVAEAVEPEQVDVTPFAMAGVKFKPLGGSPLVLRSDQNLQVAYQIWIAPKDLRSYAGRKLDIEYALGQPAMAGGAAVVKEAIGMEQFDATGSLVNGKKLPLSGESLGNYMLTVSVNQPGTVERGFATMNFKVLADSPLPIEPWDVQDPSILKDLNKGVFDQERGLSYLAQGEMEQARLYFRRALDLDHANDVARAQLVAAYYERNDYAAVVSLYSETGITDDTDSTTLIRIAASLQKTGDPKKAITFLEGALRSRPQDGPIYLALAGYYEQIGNSQKAAEMTRKGKSYAPTGETNR